ncbi:MAG: DUF378 domain-containing protein [Patescibacteria group bacterium]
MKALHKIAFVLVIIGGLNWLVIGIFNAGLADLIGYGISKVVYILVGLSAVYLIVTHKKTCSDCVSSTPSTPASPTV